jgi:hypothetical protein
VFYYNNNVQLHTMMKGTELKIHYYLFLTERESYVFQLPSSFSQQIGSTVIGSGNYSGQDMVNSMQDENRSKFVVLKNENFQSVQINTSFKKSSLPN